MYGGTLGNADHEEQALQFLLRGILEGRRPEQLRHGQFHRRSKQAAISRIRSNIDGRLRTVYDPFHDYNSIRRREPSRRTPFPGNVIPANRFDPVVRFADQAVLGA